MNKKEWLLLLYLNGNNDLAPEMIHSFLMAQTSVFSTKVTVLVQISLASKQMVELIRPHGTPQVDTGIMNGRYFIENKQIVLLEPLFHENMSDPKALQSFVDWGITRFPAKKTMLYLGGHGYEYQGCMLDFTGGKPWMMGYASMAQAITNGVKSSGEKIDILFVDTCNINQVKAIVTFIRYGTQSIRYLLVPNSVSAMEGYPMEKIVGVFSETNVEKKPQDIIEMYKNLFHNALSRYQLIRVAVDLEQEEASLSPIELSNGEVYAWLASINPMMTEEKKKQIYMQFKKYLISQQKKFRGH